MKTKQEKQTTELLCKCPHCNTEQIVIENHADPFRLDGVFVCENCKTFVRLQENVIDYFPEFPVFMDVT